MRAFQNRYYGKKVLITGHSGFKGSWLSLWLKKLGANIIGLSSPNCSNVDHWKLLSIEKQIKEFHFDIRDFDQVRRVLQKSQPDVVFHLAAQPLVRRAYADPSETWSVNVLGTSNLLEACRGIKSINGILVVTSDKCYQIQKNNNGYVETDPLGGCDPYSASKAASEIVVNSYRSSFFNSPCSAILSTARAGNVIGGGDWSQDRIFPDICRAYASGEVLKIRSGNAIRPWQHVLDCLSGYLILGSYLLEGRNDVSGSWNFGPKILESKSVLDLLNKVNESFMPILWQETTSQQPHETPTLLLDSSKANRQLNWCPVWSFDEAIEQTVDWFLSYMCDKSVISNHQIDLYMEMAKRNKVSWLTE